MNLLKKKNWGLCLLLTIVTQGLFPFVLASYLDLYDEDAWYANWRYWFFASICFIFPVGILFIVFMIQMTCKVAKTLDVPGSEVYNTPYSWILCIVVPVIGWVLLLVMYVFILMWIVVMLAKGKGEVYLDNMH